MGEQTNEDRHVVRLNCGHETLEVVSGPGTATAIGARYRCRECNRDQVVVETFRVEP